MSIKRTSDSIDNAQSIVPIPPSVISEVALPQHLKDLDTATFGLYRQIERQYQCLPWPDQLRNIVVYTQVLGGQGDVAAAGKAIAAMQKLCPTLTFDWVLKDAQMHRYDPGSFLRYKDNVRVRTWGSDSPEKSPGNFLITGPLRISWSLDYIEEHIQRKINGPIFGFLENADSLIPFYPECCQRVVQGFSKKQIEDDPQGVYRKVHSLLFPSLGGVNRAHLPMGLQSGSGIFIDPDLVQAPRSRVCCCSSYLPKIQDVSLRTDILEAMNITDDRSEPDYDQYSFNSGYAQRPISWAKFIDCVAIHEKHKDVVIVLNQRGEFDHFTTQQFQHYIFTVERLAFLQAHGYGSVRLKGEEKEEIVLQEDANNLQCKRRLTVITRHSFTPGDMRSLQLASERSLATGDNTAAESISAGGCQLYAYEDVHNGGCKWRFLQQQVDIAKQISPNLGRFLALFGGDCRLPNPSLNQPLNQEQMAEMEELLNDPKLGGDTLAFCKKIVADYSFAEVLESALKRTAWHYLMPQLDQIEANALDEEFRRGIVAYLRDPQATHQALRVRALPELAKKIQETVLSFQIGSSSIK